MILSGILSAYFCFTILGFYISILVVFKILFYLAGMIKSFDSFISAILVEDFYMDYSVRA